MRGREVFQMKKIVVLASDNPGKIAEIQALFANTLYSILPQRELHIPPVEETGLSFIENAILKARHTCLYTDYPVIADDSGLEVDYLQGAPGIYSARYAGAGKNSVANMEKLLADLKNVPIQRRGATFRAVLVYMRHAKDPAPSIAEGIWRGFIAEAPRGERGFGYDPIFYLPDYGCTAAELSPEIKNSISHRGQALAALLQLLIL